MNNYTAVKEKTFSSPYEAGFDCGLHGADNLNSHYRFFLSKESMQEWERGKRNAEEKNSSKPTNNN